MEYSLLEWKDQTFLSIDIFRLALCCVINLLIFLQVANIGPASYNFDESLTTLRYANRAKNIKNKPRINEDPKDALLREFQEEIARFAHLSFFSMSWVVISGVHRKLPSGTTKFRHYSVMSQIIFILSVDSLTILGWYWNMSQE